jgi:hypothetical protein
MPFIWSRKFRPSELSVVPEVVIEVVIPEVVIEVIAEEVVEEETE